jgi:hypothetical protein
MRLKLYYGVSYLEHNTNDVINNFFRVLGANSIGVTGSRFKWGSTCSARRKIIPAIPVSTTTASTSWPTPPIMSSPLQFKPSTAARSVLHQGPTTRAPYRNRAALTLPSRTTLRGSAAYTTRIFGEDSRRFDWVDLGLGASSLGRGVSLTALNVSPAAEPPHLHLHFILASPPVGSWDGYQAG